jgi:ubiquinone/menaquinone biosynthesis C-methylase UbiE
MLSPQELDEANRRIGAGTLLHRDGTLAPRPLAQALATAARTEIYRIEESIIWLLADLALVNADAVRESAITAERKVVQAFYDSYGWHKNEGGLFNDTVEFTDTRVVAREYQRLCNERIGRELSSGQFLLDVASGAIPMAEYLEFSRNYRVRICVDFSIRALQEARAKLGDSGLYVLGDITRLPLAPDGVDAVISLHTIYHVPRSEQTRAVDELVRVTRRGGRIVVVYVWASSGAMNSYFRLRGCLGNVRRLFSSRGRPLATAGAGEATRPPLYFSPQDYDWFAREIAPVYRARLKTWSAVSMVFQARFFNDSRAGRFTRALVKWLEDAFPRLAGRYGQYPMFVIDKPL